ncbi:MAG: hypothetical protein LBR36_06870 [Bacteroidales bacterium]|jgi:hypothetical protein|nr:hypothetical protein [Bacteroidales bacterium]
MSSKKAKTLTLVAIFLLGVSHAGVAQDIITLRNGEEVKAKVTEVSTTEIKYKSWTNLNGPIRTVPKTDVFMIKYENGEKELFEQKTTKTETPKAEPETEPAKVVETPTTTTNEVRFTSASSGKQKRQKWEQKANFGIYANPVGFLVCGPIFGGELTLVKHLIIDAHIRVPRAGLLTGFFWAGAFGTSNLHGIGVGADVKYITHGRKGGFYVGPAFEWWKTSYNVEHGWWEGTGVIAAVDLGYKFMFKSGLYLRLGGYLGGSVTTSSYWEEFYYGTPDIRVDYNKGEGAFFFAADVAIGFVF